MIEYISKVTIASALITLLESISFELNLSHLADKLFLLHFFGNTLFVAIQVN